MNNNEAAARKQEGDAKHSRIDPEESIIEEYHATLNNRIDSIFDERAQYGLFELIYDFFALPKNIHVMIKERFTSESGLNSYLIMLSPDVDANDWWFIDTKVNEKVLLQYGFEDLIVQFHLDQNLPAFKPTEAYSVGSPNMPAPIIGNEIIKRGIFRAVFEYSIRRKNQGYVFNVRFLDKQRFKVFLKNDRGFFSGPIEEAVLANFPTLYPAVLHFKDKHANLYPKVEQGGENNEEIISEQSKRAKLNGDELTDPQLVAAVVHQLKLKFEDDCDKALATARVYERIMDLTLRIKAQWGLFVFIYDYFKDFEKIQVEIRKRLTLPSGEIVYALVIGPPSDTPYWWSLQTTASKRDLTERGFEQQLIQFHERWDLPSFIADPDYPPRDLSCLPNRFRGMSSQEVEQTKSYFENDPAFELETYLFDLPGEFHSFINKDILSGGVFRAIVKYFAIQVKIPFTFNVYGFTHGKFDVKLVQSIGDQEAHCFMGPVEVDILVQYPDFYEEVIQYKRKYPNKFPQNQLQEANTQGNA